MGRGYPFLSTCVPESHCCPNGRRTWTLPLTTSSLQARERAVRHFNSSLVAEPTGRLHTMSRGSLTFHCLNFPTRSFIQQKFIEHLLRAISRRHGPCGLSSNQAGQDPLPHGIRCPVGSAERDRKGHQQMRELVCTKGNEGKSYRGQGQRRCT